jgi:hypothetical protein
MKRYKAIWKKAITACFRIVFFLLTSSQLAGQEPTAVSRYYKAEVSTATQELA